MSDIIVIQREELKDILREVFEEMMPTPKEDEKEECYSRAEACDILHVTYPTLWRWARERYLIPIKVGNRVLYPKSEVHAIMTGEHKSIITTK